MFKVSDVWYCRDGFVVSVFFVLCNLKSHGLAIFYTRFVVLNATLSVRFLERMTCWLVMRLVTSAKIPVCYTREREPGVARQPRANFNNRCDLIIKL
jgi:hypothetical protein